MEKENRKHKDSLFVELFYQDETAKISFEVDGQVLVLGEHQSTVNPNIPLKMPVICGKGV